VATISVKEAMKSTFAEARQGRASEMEPVWVDDLLRG
jgi:hypothetical protein